jgi:quercetin dioxygenase-like cupin family protein
MAILSMTDTTTLDVVGDRVRVLVDGTANGGQFELFDVEGEQASGPPPHAHPWFESYLVLDGELLIEVDGVGQVVGAGTTVHIPAGTVHRYEIATPTARFIVATAGTGAGKLFTDLSANAPGLPTPETMGAVIEVAKRNGLTSPLF